ncbi:MULTISPECIES: NACHT domain-containing protein [unclassified Streptomyces]|uniref:NACHT domain-containing protein n=1 Tax=unclassified Streptomyces TaxID=2593676 RepID=UPI0023655FB3|nr:MULTISPECIES: NACHT domain-containing protein [unclassified Streptomyces]MDF3146782.1 NACHT domain-containing protein [Streptomyces sp. T21Q-yed]WDF39758.1 NACHT domain-containing protein [Streptomyces sp. T12]
MTTDIWRNVAVVLIGLVLPAIGAWWMERSRGRSAHPAASELLLYAVRAVEAEQLRGLGRPLYPPFSMASAGMAAHVAGQSIAAIFGGLHDKRLVILGDAGTGKTTAARRLVPVLLDEGPVPVMVGLSSWEPASQSVQDWFISRVADRYGVEADHVRGLTAARRLLPVLDGLDELPDSQRATCVPLLMRWLDGFPGYVLTCRTDAYQDMADLLGPGVGTTVTLRPLWAQDVAAELRAVDAQRWEPVATAVEDDPSGPLAEALSSPWFLSLAASGYEGHRHRDPEELTDRRELPDAAAVRRRIWDTADPTVRIEGWGTDGRRRLELVADATGSEADGLLLWWRMAGKYGSSWAVAYVTAALLGIPALVGLAADRGLASSLSGMYVIFGYLAFLTPVISHQEPRRLGRRPLLTLVPLRGAAFWLLATILGAGLIGLPIGMAFILDPEWVLSGTWFSMGLMAIGVIAGLVLMITGPNTEPGRAHRAGDLHSDLWVALLTSSAVTALACLPIGLLSDPGRGTTGGHGLPWFVWAATSLGFFTTVLLTRTPWGRYRLTHLGLVLDGELPLRLGRFLAEALDQGLLVPADGYGAGCYTFRHSLAREALLGGGTDRLARVRATERFQKEIRAEVLTLPESVAYLAFTSDGSSERYAREREHIAGLADEVLTNELRAAADKGAEAYERYRKARQRMSEALGVSVWANSTTARLYGLAALLAGGIVCAAVGLLTGADQLEVGAGVVAVAAGVCLSLLLAARLEATPASRRFIYMIVAVLALYTSTPWALSPFLPEGSLGTIAAITAAADIFFLVAWLYARPHVARARAVLDDDPDAWPELPAIRHHRGAAFEARQTWLTVVARDGVMPLIRGRLRVGTDTGTVPALPAIAPSRLTGSRRSDQFVGTEAADEIAFHLRELESASIGVSGQRGVGKSSLMQRFCTSGPLSAADDLLVLAPAPTSYDPREFLIHLFAEVCRRVTGSNPGDDGHQAPDPVRRRNLVQHVGAALMVAAGVLITVVTLLWPELTAAAEAVTGHAKALVIAGGVVLTVAGIAWAVSLSLPAEGAGRRRGNPRHTDVLAAAHLRTLHYQLTFLRTRNAQLALPGGLQLADGSQVQHTQQVLTYPELVSRFRAFLTEVARDRDQSGGRVVIGIDELDKLGSSQDAERFLNDLKVVFGIRGCHFLVAVSEDALTTFGRHVLDVRTAFDSAFDRVVAVRPLSLGQARTLLELRGVWLPGPYLWLCQVLSGGLPRDLLRAVTSLATERALRLRVDLRQLSRKLIEDDARSVLSAQTRYAATLSGAHAPRAARWIADASQAAVTADEWEAAIGAAPPVDPDQYDVAHAVTQVRAYLALGATLMRTFTEGDVAASLDWLRLAGPDPVDRLTTARAKLATEPETSWSAVNRYRAEIPGLAPLPEPT